MILANVNFGGRRRRNPAHLEEAAEFYLGALLHSGQIGGEYFLTWTKDRLNAHVLLAGPGAFALRHHTAQGQQALAKVAEAFGGQPAWSILQDDAGTRPSSWKGAPFLYLYAHAADWDSPVRRGDAKPPVPVFLLPISPEQKEQLYFWQTSYAHHDHLWLGSGALESAAYRQLADPNSQLAQTGRELGRALETATGVPTFYYLMRFWARSPEDEAQRRCPGCGGQWAIPPAAKQPARFPVFDFGCDDCRLLSHLGVSLGAARDARIGEPNCRKRGEETSAVPSGLR